MRLSFVNLTTVVILHDAAVVALVHSNGSVFATKKHLLVYSLLSRYQQTRLSYRINLIQTVLTGALL